MKKSIAIAVLVISLTSRSITADGTVTTPVSNPATSWRIASVQTNNGVGALNPSIVISVAYLDASLAIVRIDAISITSLTEIDSLCAQLETAAAGEDATNNPGANIKRYRQRLTKWLVDNSKITNVTPE